MDVAKVSTKHPDYLDMKEIWDRNIRAIAGQKTIHKYGKAYLEPTVGQTLNWDGDGGKESFNRYMKNARFPDVPAEALEGMEGILFGNDPKGELDETVTIDGLSILELAREVARAYFACEKRILMVEAPNQQTQPGLRQPYIIQYDAASMINWKKNDEGKYVLCVFEEKVDNPANKYDHGSIKQYREYTIMDGVGAVNLYNEKEELIASWAMGWPEIPIVVIGKGDKPPVTRVVDCAMAAYRNSADLQMALHISASPTPYSGGMSEDQYKLNAKGGIGTGANWYLGPDPNASAGYMEFSGKGVDAIEKRMEAEIAMAADYAIKLSQPAGVEAAKSKQIRDTSQKSVLGQMGDTIDQGMHDVLELYNARKLGSPVDTEFEIQIKTAEEAQAQMICLLYTSDAADE